MSIHMLMKNCEEKTQYILKQCITALKQENDAKYGRNFFSFEAIDDMKSSSKEEYERIEFLKEYAVYVFDFIAVKGDKYSDSKSRSGDDRAEMLLDLIEQVCHHHHHYHYHHYHHHHHHYKYHHFHHYRHHYHHYHHYHHHYHHHHYHHHYHHHDHR